MNEDAIFPKLGSRYMVDEDIMVQAYAVEDQVKTGIHRSGQWKQKRISFDELEAMSHDDYKHASGAEIALWAESGGTIIKDRIVVCWDGIYMWIETFQYDKNLGPHLITGRYVKID